MFTGMLRLLLLTILFTDTYRTELTPDSLEPPESPNPWPAPQPGCKLPNCGRVDSCGGVDIHCARDDIDYDGSTATCNGDRSCVRADIIVETVECIGDGSCKEAAINTGGTVTCSGEGSCNAAAITCAHITDCSVVCSGIDSCQNTRIYNWPTWRSVVCDGPGDLTCSGLTYPDSAKSITINRDIKSPYSDTNDNMFKLMTWTAVLAVIAVFVLICILVSIATTNAYKYCCKYAVLVDTDGDKETDSENALIEFAK